MEKLDKIQEVKVAEQSIEKILDLKRLLTKLLTILLQGNLKCRLVVRKECWQKRKETLKRTNYVVVGNKISRFCW